MGPRDSFDVGCNGTDHHTCINSWAACIERKVTSRGIHKLWIDAYEIIRDDTAPAALINNIVSLVRIDEIVLDDYPRAARIEENPNTMVVVDSIVINLVVIMLLNRVDMFSRGRVVDDIVIDETVPPGGEYDRGPAIAALPVVDVIVVKDIIPNHIVLDACAAIAEEVERISSAVVKGVAIHERRRCPEIDPIAPQSAGLISTLWPGLIVEIHVSIMNFIVDELHINGAQVQLHDVIVHVPDVTVREPNMACPEIDKIKAAIRGRIGIAGAINHESVKNEVMRCHAGIRVGLMHVDAALQRGRLAWVTRNRNDATAPVRASRERDRPVPVAELLDIRSLPDIKRIACAEAGDALRDGAARSTPIGICGRAATIAIIASGCYIVCSSIGHTGTQNAPETEHGGEENG